MSYDNNRRRDSLKIFDECFDEKKIKQLNESYDNNRRRVSLKRSDEYFDEKRIKQPNESYDDNRRRGSLKISDECFDEKRSKQSMKKIGSFEDLLEIIGTTGPWNIMVFSLCSTSSILLAMQVLTYEFVGATPDHWCHVDQLLEANWTQKQILDFAIPFSNTSNYEKCQMYDHNYTQAVELGYEAAKEGMTLGEKPAKGIISCLSRDFNRTQYQSTLVTEFDLVCERRPLYSTTQASAMLGVLIGSLSAGPLTNIFGRRKIAVVFVFLVMLTGSLSCAAPTFEVYVLFKILASCCAHIVYHSGFVNTIELCSANQRAPVGSLFLLPWVLGYMLVPGLAYFIRPWRWLNAAYTITVLFHSSYYWLMPESPRWLISKGRYQEAVEILTWAAMVNRRSLPKPEELIAIMKTIPMLKDEKPKETWLETTCRHLKDTFVLITMREFRSRAIVCGFIWFAVSMVYYGISLGSSNLSADPYIFMLLGAAIELPSYILLWPSMAYLGRRISVVSQYIICGSAIAATGILLATVKGVPKELLMTLTLSGKLAITATFQLLYIYTSELFPTKYRSLAVGQGSFMARIGSMISPYIIDLLGDVVNWGPSALFGGISFLAAIASLTLPETKDATMNEAKTFTKRSSEKSSKMTGYSNEACEI